MSTLTRSGAYAAIEYIDRAKIATIARTATTMPTTLPILRDLSGVKNALIRLKNDGLAAVSALVFFVSMFITPSRAYAHLLI